MSLRNLTDSELSDRLIKLAGLHRFPAAKVDYKRAVEELKRRDAAKSRARGDIE